VVPGLASTWTVSRDGLTYAFHLRPGVRFHDGTPVTAADVVFTFRRLLSPRMQGRNVACSYLSVLEGAEEYMAGTRDDLPGIEALDRHTVRIRLTQPYLSFLEVLAMDGLNIVPRRVVERVGDEVFGQHPVGAGPFRHSSTDAAGLRLEANEDYYLGRPYLDRVDILFTGSPEGVSRAARFYRGELDVIDVPSDHLERMSRDPEVNVYRYQELSLAFLGLACSHPSVRNVRVRQAIALAIDRQALVADSPATRREALGILPPGLPGYSPQPKAFPHDPERAVRLLEEAGHPHGVGLPPVELYTTAPSEAATRLLDHLRDDLAEVGIVLQVQAVSWKELSQRIESHQAPAFLLAWVADLADPDAFLRSLFEAGGAANYFDLRDPEVERLLAIGARETNPARRAEIYRRLEGHILDLAPMVPLFHSMGLIAMKREIRGLEPGPLGMASANLERVWFGPPEALR
jgi:peptide/nickel transport system substrate-binding protein/oligopeptide transport system substrate-binding protein